MVSFGLMPSEYVLVMRKMKFVSSRPRSNLRQVSCIGLCYIIQVEKKHYFSSEGLSRSVFTRKVQVNGKGGKAIAEVKGNVREIEVYPGGTAEWWFVPVKIGKFSDLECTIKGHTEAGMVGKITIK